MSNTIQTNYRTQAYSTPAKPKKPIQAGRQNGSFSNIAAQSRTDTMEVSGGAVPQKPELSEAEEMQLFQKEFYEDLAKLTNHPSISNVAVNISDAAFHAMKDDPEYREKVLSLLQRDLGASVAPRSCSLLITVGATLEEYRGDSWPVGNDSKFHLRSKGSFYKRSAETQNKQKEFLEEYHEKKAQAKRRQQSLLDEIALKKQEDLKRAAQAETHKKSFSGITDLLKARTAAPPEASYPQKRKE